MKHSAPASMLRSEHRLHPGPSAAARGALRTSYVAALALAACLHALGAHAADGTETEQAAFRIVERWPVGGAGGWDYLALDPSGQHLLVTRESRIDVVDTTSGAVVGTIEDTPGVHGVAFAPRLKRGYTSNGRAGTVTAFDIDSFKTLKSSKVSGQNPDAIVFDPAGRHVLTFNGGSSNASVLDPMSLKVIATIALPGKPEFAVTDGEGRVFVNIESEKGKLAVIDALALQVVSAWRLPGCARPTGLAMDRAHRRLFSVCDAKTMVVTDAASGKNVARLGIGEQPDAAAFDPGTGTIFSANGDGTLTIIHEDDPDHFRLLPTLTTQASARTLALDAASHRVYLVAADFAAATQPQSADAAPSVPMQPDSFTVLVAAPRRTPGI